MVHRPLVSVISPSLNCARLIGRCIESVRAQTYDRVEHIIVDGASTDGTLDILRGYPHVKWISEPDGGEAEALNKALRMASGEIVHWLNVDDMYYTNDVLELVVRAFNEHPECDVVYGKGVAVNEAGEVLWYRRPLVPFTLRGLMRWTTYLNLFQPAMFYSRKLVDTVGEFNASLKYAIDNDYWLRIAQAGFQAHFIERVLSSATLVREGAKSGGSWEEQHAAWQEVTTRFCAYLSESERITFWKDYYVWRLCPPAPYTTPPPLPDSAEGWEGYTCAALELGQLERAVQAVNHMNVQYSTRPATFLLISEVLQQAGQHELALQAAVHARKLTSEMAFVPRVESETPTAAPKRADAAVGPWESRLRELVTSREKRVAVHQFVTNVHAGDAVGHCVLRTRDQLRAWGIESEIFCQGGDAALAGEFRPFTDHLQLSSPENILLYHPNDGRTPIIPYLLSVPDRKVLYYHNITPEEYFAPWDKTLQEICKLARISLFAIRSSFEGAICDSQYNASELATLGYPHLHVVPIPFLSDRLLEETPDAGVSRRLRDGKTNILFAGRIAPNKCQHELIEAFAYYREHINPDSRLVIVGTLTEGDRYCKYVLDRISELGLENDVVLTGHVTFPELVAYYRTANVFLCLSEHEGFCVPLVESMAMDVPVIAYESSAVGETLGGAGVLLASKDRSEIAEAIESIRQDPATRDAQLARQRARLAELSPACAREALAKALCELFVSERDQATGDIHQEA